MYRRVFYCRKRNEAYLEPNFADGQWEHDSSLAILHCAVLLGGTVADEIAGTIDGGQNWKDMSEFQTVTASQETFGDCEARFRSMVFIILTGDLVSKAMATFVEEMLMRLNAEDSEGVAFFSWDEVPSLFTSEG